MRTMKYIISLALLFVLSTRVHKAYGQFVVVDVSADASADIEDAEEAEVVADEGLSLDTQVSMLSTALGIYGTAVSTTEFTMDSYEFMLAMDTAPSNDYSSYSNNGLVQWVQVNNPEDTYGNAQQWVNAVTTGSGAATANQSVSIVPTGQLSGYASLQTDGQQAIAAVGATIDLNDAANITSLQTLGAVRGHSQQRQIDIATLEAATHSQDSSEQTVMSELQRINQALLMDLRDQQEKLEMQQAEGIQELLETKSEIDALKGSMSAANAYELKYGTFVSPQPLTITGSASH